MTSMSVDDLVASLSGAHIGQEARDLALLQAQLAESLFGVAPAPAAHHHHRGRRPTASARTPPCPTPRARSPVPAPAVNEMEEMDEDSDERMVEALLLPASYGTNTINTTNTNSSNNNSCYSASSSNGPSPTSACGAAWADAPPPSPAGASLFTTTDPFYLAQAQAAQALSANAGRNFSAAFSSSAFPNNAFPTNTFPNNAFTSNTFPNAFPNAFPAASPTTTSPTGGFGMGMGMAMTNSTGMAAGPPAYHAFAQWGEVPAYQCGLASPLWRCTAAGAGAELPRVGARTVHWSWHGARGQAGAAAGPGGARGDGLDADRRLASPDCLPVCRVSSRLADGSGGVRGAAVVEVGTDAQRMLVLPALAPTPGRLGSAPASGSAGVCIHSPCPVSTHLTYLDSSNLISTHTDYANTHDLISIHPTASTHTPAGPAVRRKTSARTHAHSVSPSPHPPACASPLHCTPLHPALPCPPRACPPASWDARISTPVRSPTGRAAPLRPTHPPLPPRAGAVSLFTRPPHLHSILHIGARPSHPGLVRAACLSALGIGYRTGQNKGLENGRSCLCAVDRTGQGPENGRYATLGPVPVLCPDL
ncbi:hypothetical protein HYPSUDRAFT_55348 [Hypholoma sublateritium FD-334 SS-4]|uniref:Uncharacterized protein n=1 Tax=Hypholoma sublateritium (strain FD-334 SS-4) TaxID=945553 RepID=A0A0D2PP15_HYPSF|nr:hypothetical protein HYPSUDRAFT_55348 [Hypholoma sublateritium FD-334 SS-4]